MNIMKLLEDREVELDTSNEKIEMLENEIKKLTQRLKSESTQIKIKNLTAENMDLVDQLNSERQTHAIANSKIQADNDMLKQELNIMHDICKNKSNMIDVDELTKNINKFTDENFEENFKCVICWDFEGDTHHQISCCSKIVCEICKPESEVLNECPHCRTKNFSFSKLKKLPTMIENVKNQTEQKIKDFIEPKIDSDNKLALQQSTPKSLIVPKLKYHEFEVNLVTNGLWWPGLLGSATNDIGFMRKIIIRVKLSENKKGFKPSILVSDMINEIRDKIEDLSSNSAKNLNIIKNLNLERCRDGTFIGGGFASLRWHDLKTIDELTNNCMLCCYIRAHYDLMKYPLYFRYRNQVNKKPSRRKRNGFLGTPILLNLETSKIQKLQQQQIDKTIEVKEVESMVDGYFSRLLERAYPDRPLQNMETLNNFKQNYEIAIFDSKGVYIREKIRSCERYEPINLSDLIKKKYKIVVDIEYKPKTADFVEIFRKAII